MTMPPYPPSRESPDQRQMWKRWLRGVPNADSDGRGQPIARPVDARRVVQLGERMIDRATARQYPRRFVCGLCCRWGLIPTIGSSKHQDPVFDVLEPHFLLAYCSPPLERN
jgi:hypothetical protein